MRSYPRNSRLNTPEAVGRWYLNRAKEEQKMKDALREEEVIMLSDHVIRRLIRDEESNGMRCVESYRRLVREQERRKIRANMNGRRRNDENVLQESNQQAGNASGLRGGPASDLRPRGLHQFAGMDGEELLMSSAEERVGMTRQEHLDRLRRLGSEESKQTSESIFRQRRMK